MAEHAHAIDNARGASERSGMGTFTIQARSTLASPHDVVWAHAQTMQGVNFELAPFVRMTVPARARGRSLRDVPMGVEAFVSYLMLFAVVPFDAHHLTLERVTARGFDEESWSWMQRRWRHERRVTSASDNACVVEDTVVVEPRFAPVVLVRPIVQAMFTWRHRRLRERFGDAEI